jgi:4-diphosphocytidyl-2-C-methyl-D-erythritol kinase
VTDLPANTVEVDAPAKVNLFLRVLGRRTDGYHDLETAVLPISLGDRLRIHAFADPGQFRTLTLSLDVVGDPDLVRGVPADETNLALRAATALADRADPRGFAEILLEKRVPSAAGLGGGSADAAATLVALNDLWGVGLPPHELHGIGAGVGSDVPALLAQGPVLATGRGDVVERVSVAPLRWAIVTFPFRVRTADAFRWWDEDGSPSGPDPAEVIHAADRKAVEDRGGDVGALGDLLFNDLEGPVARRHPEVRTALDGLVASGAVGAVMCGSGPSVAGLLSGERRSLDREVEEDLVRLTGREPVYVTSWTSAGPP